LATGKRRSITIKTTHKARAFSSGLKDWPPKLPLYPKVVEKSGEEETCLNIGKK
jgi:hypothetical protein